MHNYNESPTDAIPPTLGEIEEAYEDSTEMLKEALVMAGVGVVNANQERARIMEAPQKEATIAGHMSHHNCVGAQLYAAMVYLLQADMMDVTGEQRRRNRKLAFEAVVQASRDTSWAKRYLLGTEKETENETWE